MLAATEYLKRHNSVASLVHKNLCSHFGVVTCDKPWLYVPESVVQVNEVKILWDFDIRTDRHISAHRPDIVMVNNDSHSAILIDIAVPADTNIISKETEKIVKYHDLCIELKRLWNLKSINVIPIVIGCLESFSSNLLKYLKELPGKHPIAPLVKTAILGSAHLLRRVLGLPEFG